MKAVVVVVVGVEAEVVMGVAGGAMVEEVAVTVVVVMGVVVAMVEEVGVAMAEVGVAMAEEVMEAEEEEVAVTMATIEVGEICRANIFT